MNDNRSLIIGGVIGALLIACLCCLVAIGAGAYGWLQVLQDTDFSYDYTNTDSSSEPTVTPHALESWELSGENLDLAEITLERLTEMAVPENNPAEMAVRLGGVDFVPETYPDPDWPYEVGEHMKFWINDTDTNENKQVAATLGYVTDHAYFWIGDSVRYNKGDLESLAAGN
jgi:hypothetical protein